MWPPIETCDLRAAKSTLLAVRSASCPALAFQACVYVADSLPVQPAWSYEDSVAVPAH